MKELKKKVSGLKVLYAEDDLGVQQQYDEFFSQLFKEVYSCANGVSALELYRKHSPDIVILDIKMPMVNGIEVAKKIRETDKDTRILITTAYTDESFTLDAVELYITRYLVKPVGIDELVPALKKCVAELEEIRPEYIPLADDYRYDYDNKTVINNNEAMPLTNIESRLLELLLENKDRVVVYNKIESYVWGNEYMSLETLRAHVKSLRKKLPDGFLVSVKGIGYKIDKNRIDL